VQISAETIFRIIFVMLWYECFDLNRKIKKTNKTLDEIYSMLDKRLPQREKSFAEMEEEMEKRRVARSRGE
jgi:hypothetical protein